MKNQRFHKCSQGNSPLMLRGYKFNRLLALNLTHRPHHPPTERWVWRCLCDCGNFSFVSPRDLIRGKIKSCGCLLSEVLLNRNLTHGQSNRPEYWVWNTMVQRCTNPNANNYENYGGRGICVCERWKNFANFLEDMGYRPSENHLIERIDNNGDYEPSNCKWATNLEQQNNRRNNVFIEWNGKKQTLRQWERELGMKKGCISGRISRGWSLTESVSIPLNRKR